VASNVDHPLGAPADEASASAGRAKSELIEGSSLSSARIIGGFINGIDPQQTLAAINFAFRTKISPAAWRCHERMR
jgi:hypothetical protein